MADPMKPVAPVTRTGPGAVKPEVELSLAMGSKPGDSRSLPME